MYMWYIYLLIGPDSVFADILRLGGESFGESQTLVLGSMGSDIALYLIIMSL